MVVGRPIADRNSRIYRFSKIIWDLHHLLCLREPKGTEICAFRKIFNYFPKISADEVFIEYKIKEAGFKIVYEPKAYGYTKTPYSLNHFFNQRKRCFFGHLEIWKKYKFRTSSIKPFLVLRIFLKYFFNNFNSLIIIIPLIEILARINAIFDYFLKKDYYIW